MCNRIQVGFEGTGVVLGKDKERGKRWDGPWSLFHLWTCHALFPAGPCNPCHWGLMLPTWSLTVRYWRESFPSALGPIQGLCLLWESLRGEKVLRIHPISSREKRNSGAMQQVWQWRGREMVRVSLFLFLRSSCFRIWSNASHSSALDLSSHGALPLRSSAQGFPLNRALQCSPMQNQPNTKLSLSNTRWTWTSPEAL